MDMPGRGESSRQHRKLYMQEHMEDDDDDDEEEEDYDDEDLCVAEVSSQQQAELQPIARNIRPGQEVQP